MAVAVAVHAHVVHDVDVQHVALHVFMHALGSRRHAFEEIILCGQVVPQLGRTLYLARRVYVRLAVARRNAD